MRSLALHETKAHLEKKFKQTSDALQDECSHLLLQFDKTCEELDKAHQNERFLHHKLYQSEQRLSQMRLYIDEFRLHIYAQEEELSAPVQPGLKRTNKGQHEMTAEVQRQLHWQSQPGKKRKAYNPLDDETRWPKPFLRVVHPQTEKE